MPAAKKKEINKKSLLKIILQVILVFILFLSLPGINIYEITNLKPIPGIHAEIPSPAPYPKNITSQEPPKLSADGIIIIDLPSQVTIYEKNSRKRLQPASTTKIVTALVALDNYDPEKVVEIHDPINEGRIMGLVNGEKITVENLIYGALIHSANDAAYALAQADAGGVNGFILKMNQKVFQLGLKDTNLTNAVGFEDPNHYTTAYDLAQLSRIALTNNKIKKIISTKNVSVSDVDYSIFHNLENVNVLLGKVPGVAGIKTGWTKEAGEVLSTLVKRQDREILIIILKSADRFGETEALIKWVFGNFRWIEIKPTELPPFIQ